MLKTLAIALLAMAMSVGLAQAHWHKHKHMIPGCAIGQPTATTCACGTAANHRPLLCHKGAMVPSLYGLHSVEPVERKKPRP
jgi:hypothetical protein